MDWANPGTLTSQDGARIGLARQFPGETTMDEQCRTLEQAGCDRILVDRVDPRQWMSQSEPHAIFLELRQGDTLVIWRIDRLAHSLNRIVAAIEELDTRGIRLLSLREGIDTAHADGRLVRLILSTLADCPVS